MVFFVLALPFFPAGLLEEPKGGNKKPQHERRLQGEEAKTAAKLLSRAASAEAANDYREAIKLRQELLEYRAKIQGGDHWEVWHAQWDLEVARLVSELPAESQANCTIARAGGYEISKNYTPDQLRRAQSQQLEYCRWFEKVLGPRHPFTVAAYNDMSFLLRRRGLTAEAMKMAEQATALARESVKDRHPITANCYLALAVNLDDLKKYAEAQQYYQKVVELMREFYGEVHPTTATMINELAGILHKQNKLAEAEPLFRKALDLRRQLFGEKSLETAHILRNLASTLSDQRKYGEAQLLFQKLVDVYSELLGEKHQRTAHANYLLCYTLFQQKKYAEAQPVLLKTYQTYLGLYGKKNRETAQVCFWLAHAISEQYKYAEAEPYYRQLLEMQILLLGEKDYTVGACYSHLAHNLFNQGKYEDARPLYQKHLEIYLEVLGEKHRETAKAFAWLGSNLTRCNEYAEAQKHIQKSLDIMYALGGEKDLNTALCHLMMGNNFFLQMKFSEAQPHFEKSVEINRIILGANHAGILNSYNALAGNLLWRGQLQEARALYEHTLRLSVDLLGEKNLRTAQQYMNLAFCQKAIGEWQDALICAQHAVKTQEELLGPDSNVTIDTYDKLSEYLYMRGRIKEVLYYRLKILEHQRKRYGENHFETANAYDGVAYTYTRLGMFQESREYFGKASSRYRQLHGEQFELTGRCYHSMGEDLILQKKYPEAEQLLAKAANASEVNRLRAFDRKLEESASTVHFNDSAHVLMFVKAELNRPVEAWQICEAQLARRLANELAAFRQEVLPFELKQEHEQLIERLKVVLPRIPQLIANDKAEEREELARLLAERKELEDRFTALAEALKKRDVADLASVQAALPDDAALVLWIDYWSNLDIQYHWGCVVRKTGPPHWEKLPRSKYDGKRNDNNNEYWNQQALQNALRTGTISAKELNELVTTFREERLTPLVKHLSGIKQLYVVPVHWMHSIPIELLSNDYTISYVPSGTFLVRLKDRQASIQSGLLALGDPIFNRPEDQKGVPPLPDKGLLILQVADDSAAAKARLQPGDVILKYGDTDVISQASLDKAIQSQKDAKEVPVTIWREGVEKPFTRTIAAGRMGVILSQESARETISNRRKEEAKLQAIVRGDWKDLPGTRAEVVQIARLFGSTAKTLLDGAASEQTLDELRRNGELANYRYLHFATHGKANEKQEFESTLILSQDSLPKGLSAREGEPFINGQLTARKVLDYWKLDAELVTLSACESGLGRNGRGDGLLGFSQAFLSRGARAVCLSLWKVDDAATALLMVRFYQNLLGKRPGLTAPMKKAQALDEAKRWLRELSAEEALKLTAAITNGVIRGNRSKDEVLNLVVPKTKEEDGKRPFSHPRYWAAFILMGDPN